MVDNVVSHADEVREFRTLVAADAGSIEALVPIASGLLLVLRVQLADRV